MAVKPRVACQILTNSETEEFSDRMYAVTYKGTVIIHLTVIICFKKKCHYKKYLFKCNVLKTVK